MPRLRKVQIEKYHVFDHEFSDEELIDTSGQEEIIDKFKKSNNKLKDSKLGKTVFKIYISIILFINLCLITIPYYRKGANSIISAIACIMTFLPILVAYSTISTILTIIDFEYLEVLKNRTFLIIVVIIYTLIITIFKFINGFVSADLIYLLPILLTYCVIDLNAENNLINKSIEELEKYKYDYKEA